MSLLPTANSRKFHYIITLTIITLAHDHENKNIYPESMCHRSGWGRNNSILSDLQHPFRRGYIIHLIKIQSLEFHMPLKNFSSLFGNYK